MRESFIVIKIFMVEELEEREGLDGEDNVFEF